MAKTTFSASRISELLAKGTGKTAQNYCLDLALQSIGIEDDYESSEMRHGTVNQHVAYSNLVQPILFPDSEWFDQYVEINEYCGASPDVKIREKGKEIPLDIKCPYYLDTYSAQIHSPPRKYELQCQMQMMAFDAPYAYLLFYLTKPEKFGETNWQEYPLDIKERYKLFRFEYSKEMAEAIKEAVNYYNPIKDSLIDLLLSAENINFETYFDLSIRNNQLREISKSDNILGLKKLYKFENNFYYIKR